MAKGKKKSGGKKDKKSKKEKKGLLAKQERKALKGKGEKKALKHKKKDKTAEQQSIMPLAPAVMSEGGEVEKVKLFGRILRYALDNLLLEESLVYRWGKQVLAKDELAKLEVRPGDDSAPQGRPIVLKQNIEGFEL